MAKKKQSKKDTEKADAAKAAEQAAAAKAAKKAAKDQKKALARAAALSAEAKDARKAVGAAEKAARKAEQKAVDAATKAGRKPPKPLPDEKELLKLALRTTQAKLTDAERRAEALQQQLDGGKRLEADRAEEALEDLIVEAAVQETVAEAILDADVAGDPLDVDPAVTVEAVAIELDEIAEEADPADPAEDHTGDARAAAAVFAQSDAGAEPVVTTTELTPPLPEVPVETEPSEAWTLLRLRQEAKRRGLTGTSNLPKAALLERLRAS